MSTAVLRALPTAVLVAGLVAIVLFGRLVLDATIAPAGWYLVAFLAVFVAVRAGGPEAGLATALLVLAGDLALAGVELEPGAGRPIPLLAHVALDAATASAALVTALAMRDAGTRLRDRDLAAQESARRLLAAARREAVARDLAAEVADARSVRQVADRFAARARELVDAAGVTVLAIGERATDRTAGGAPEAALASAGVAVAPAEVTGIVEEALDAAEPRTAIAPEAPDPPGAVPVGLVALPLLAGTGAVAAAVVTLDPPRPVEDEELGGLTLLGRIAADAVARAELAVLSRRETERATEAAQRIARLQQLAADLGRELDTRAIAALVVDAAADGTRSSAGVLHRLDPSGTDLELLHARGYPAGLLDHERRLPVDARLPGPDALRERRTVTASAGSWASQFPGASDVPSIAGLDHLAAVPLGGERPVAVLVVGRAGSGPFDADDVGFLEAVAEHGAQAILRAGLVDLLRDRDRRLGLTLGVARAGSWELDVEHRRFEASPALLRLYGLPEDARLDGLDAYLALVDQADRERVRQEIERVVAGGGSFTLEYRVRRPSGGSVQVLGIGRTFVDHAGRPARLMAIDRDVSPERAAEAERERLLAQEVEARRLNEAFFGVMSHELRTPVTTILAGARLLGRGTRLEPADREVMSDIADESERLHRLIEDLLVLSRLERGNLALAREPVHVGHLVQRVVDHEARRWPETRFETEVSFPQAVVEGEETYVEQVLRNLLSNAAKYSPAGSTVRIRVDGDGDEAAVRVLDEGPGVGSSEVDDLFSLFYRSPATAAAASGAGIGLFVCDRLIRAMGGRIWARRREDAVGSEFAFALRLAPVEDIDVEDEYGDEDEPGISAERGGPASPAPAARRASDEVRVARS